jgi:hypothetical protein
MVYLWPFLSCSCPLRRHNGQVSSSLPDLTIVQNILALCSHHENHCAVEHAWYRTLCLFHCPLENFGSPKFLTRTSICTMAYTSAYELLLANPNINCWLLRYRGLGLWSPVQHVTHHAMTLPLIAISN